MTIRKLFHYWIRKKRSGFYIFLGFIFAGIYFVGILLKDSDSLAVSAFFKPIGVSGFFILTLVFLIHLNLHANYQFLNHFKNMDHLPVKQIIHVNSFCMTLFFIISLLAIPGAVFAMEPVWEALGKWFSSRIHPKQAIYQTFNMETEAVSVPNMEAIFGKARLTPAWIMALDHLIRIFGTILIFIFFLLITCRLIFRLWAWITKPRQFDDDEKISLTPTWPLLSGQPFVIKTLEQPFLHSYDKKIRRKYRSTILSLFRKKKKSPARAASPRELEQVVGLEQETLHQLYEKARYSFEECTKADWIALRNEEQDSKQSNF